MRMNSFVLDSIDLHYTTTDRGGMAGAIEIRTL